MGTQLTSETKLSNQEHHFHLWPPKRTMTFGSRFQAYSKRDIERLHAERAHLRQLFKDLKVSQ